MTKAKNAVIAGDFMGKKVSVSFGKVSMDVGGLSALELNSRTVAALCAAWSAVLCLVVLAWLPVQ